MFPGFVFCVIFRDKRTIEHFLFWLAGTVLAQWMFVSAETNELTVKHREIIDFIEW